MKSLNIFFFIAFVNIFGMEQKEEAQIPLEPLFGGSFLIDELNLPELAREEFMSKDGFYSLPETPLASSSSDANDKKEVLKARGSKVVKVDRNFPVHDTNISRVKKRIPGRVTFYTYQQLMLDQIEQDEKRLKQEVAQTKDSEKSSLPKSSDKQGTASEQIMKKKQKNVTYRCTTPQEAEAVRLLWVKSQASPEKKNFHDSWAASMKDRDSLYSKCDKCNGYFVSVHHHRLKSSCGK